MKCYVVIGSNGASYSDFVMWVACVAGSVEQANMIVERLDKWKRKVIDIYFDDGIIEGERYNWNIENIPKPDFDSGLDMHMVELHNFLDFKWQVIEREMF